jgi:hypothetical protein
MIVREVEELAVPAQAIVAKEKAELVRIWIADGDQVVTISPRLWEDPGAWGLMLVDLAKHVANAYEAKGIKASDALATIRLAMDAEWSAPTGVKQLDE